MLGKKHILKLCFHIYIHNTNTRKSTVHSQYRMSTVCADWSITHENAAEAPVLIGADGSPLPPAELSTKRPLTPPSGLLLSPPANR